MHEMYTHEVCGHPECRQLKKLLDHIVVCTLWQHGGGAAVRPPADGGSLQWLGCCKSQGKPLKASHLKPGTFMGVNQGGGQGGV